MVRVPSSSGTIIRLRYSCFKTIGEFLELSIPLVVQKLGHSSLAGTDYSDILMIILRAVYVASYLIIKLCTPSEILEIDNTKQNLN